MTVVNSAVKGQKASAQRPTAREGFTITMTSNGTVAAADLKSIDNSAGDVVAVRAEAVTTNQSGTNPTLQLILKGKLSESASFTSLRDSSQVIDTAADDISTASTTNVTTYLDTEDFLRDQFPPVLAIAPVVGGTSTPLATSVINVEIIRKFNR